jgi:hypothetical protein
MTHVVRQRVTSHGSDPAEACPNDFLKAIRVREAA